MTYAELKQRLTDWYNEKIVAAWYRSAAILGGWLTSGLVFAPDILQFIVDRWDILGGMVLPTFSAETKTLILGLFVTFVLPPLRAYQQKKMQDAAIKQQAEAGKVIPLTPPAKADQS
ncbi:hypothetical protein J7E70_02325 [Variovorax paradoxus]|nr:hypothetical protein [Variovorax paradoxus]MBT2299290.1 hypothetical protein [Variovorax paradoxus]